MIVKSSYQEFQGKKVSNDLDEHIQTLLMLLIENDENDQRQK